jgi:hypothetical protein
MRYPSEPLIFLKPPSSLLAPGGVIRMPAVSRARRLRRRARRGDRPARAQPEARKTTGATSCAASRSPTTSPLATCKRRTMQWTRAKGFDTFCPVGPSSAMSSTSMPASPSKRASTAKLRQHASTQRLHLFAPRDSRASSLPSSRWSPATWCSPERLLASLRSSLATASKFPFPASVCCKHRRSRSKASPHATGPHSAHLKEEEVHWRRNHAAESA